jgi:hypothetical protein
MSTYRQGVSAARTPIFDTAASQPLSFVTVDGTGLDGPAVVAAIDEAGYDAEVTT